MGSVYVDGSPGWGGIGTSLTNMFTGAPGTALDNIAKAEAIKRARAAEEREQAKWDAALGASKSYDASVPAAIAPATTTIGPYVGDANDPAVTKGLPTATFTDPRLQATYEAQRKTQSLGGAAAILADPSKTSAQIAYGQVAATGVPESAQERARLDFLAGKGMPTHIGADESKQPIKQWVPVNEKNEPIGQAVASRTQPGPGYILSSPVSAAAPNPIETVPIAQNNFNELAAKLQAKVAGGLPITDAEINAARQLKAAGWKDTIEYKDDKATGKLKPIIAPAVPPAGGHAGWLFNQLDALDNPPPPPPPPPVPVEAALYRRGLTAADISDPAKLDAPLETVPAPAAPAAVAGVPRIRELPLIGTGNIPEVVKRYTDLRQVDNLAQAQQGYNSMIANMAFDTPAADLAIVIGAAKSLDPPSVVRYEESRKVEDLQGPILKVEGVINFLKGGGKLGPQVRAQLWNMVNEKAKRDRAEVAALREQHAVQIKERGGIPDDYLPKLPELVPVDVRTINTQRIDEKGTGTGIVPNTPTTAPRPAGPRGARAGRPAATPAPVVVEDPDVESIVNPGG